VALLGVLAGAQASAAATHWHSCPSYRVVQHDEYGTSTTHLFGLRAEGITCAKMRRVLHQYFFGSTRPAGRSPSDGVWVGHWRVALLMNEVIGDHRSQHFGGHYSVS
jgi:hypothetical protein